MSTRPSLITIGDIKTCPSTPSDVEWLIPRLRDADVSEIWAANHEEPPLALRRGYELSSPCYTVVYREEPILIFGASEVQPDVGCVWGLGSNLVSDAWRPFLRISRPSIELLHEDYSMLFNFVDARNTTHINWLRWLDFKFINRHEEFGAEQLPFYEFVRII